MIKSRIENGIPKLELSFEDVQELRDYFTKCLEVWPRDHLTPEGTPARTLQVWIPLLPEFQDKV